MDDISKARQSKAQRTLEAARNRPPEVRAAYAMQKILNPSFGPRLRRFDLGKDATNEIRADNIARGAMKLLRGDGVFMDGLIVRAVITNDTPPRTLLTCIPEPPDAHPTPAPIEAEDIAPEPA